MALPHFGGPWSNYIPPILQKEAKKHIEYIFKDIEIAFKNADISLNGGGKDLVFLSGHPNYFKEERVESGITYIIYKTQSYNHIQEIYTLNGKIHRENNPAYINYNKDKIIEFAYFKNGKLHNEDGPATMGHKIKGEQLFSYWYNDKFLTDKEFNKILRKMKLKKICQKFS